MPTIQVKLNPKARKSMRPSESNLVLSLGLNLLGKATTKSGPGATLATDAPQAARLVFYELAMQGDAAAPGTAEVASLAGTVKLVKQAPVFDAGGKGLTGAAAGGYAVDLEWGPSFQNVAGSTRLQLPPSIDWKSEAGTLELGCALEVGGAVEFKYSYDPTNPKKPGDFVSVSMHLLAAPKAEVYDATTILSAFDAQLSAVTKAYAPLRVLAYRSPGNGERPVFAVFASDLDPAQPFLVHTHYHGLDSLVQQGPHVARVKALAAKGLVILPEGRSLASANAASPERWTNVSDQARTTRDGEAAVQAALGRPGWKVTARNLSLHSAGGDVLRRVADLSPTKGLEADRLELLDCLYNNKKLDEAKFPGVTQATVTLAKGLGAAPIVYRRFENGDQEVSPTDGKTKKRGEVIADQLAAGRLTIFDGADPAQKGKPGVPTSHDDAATFLGVP